MRRDFEVTSVPGVDQFVQISITTNMSTICFDITRSIAHKLASMFFNYNSARMSFRSAQGYE